MKDLMILGVVFGVICACVYVLPPHGTIIYNCTWSEISPDIPIAVKEECRRLRSEKK
jgi:hypothetical protein